MGKRKCSNCKYRGHCRMAIRAEECDEWEYDRELRRDW